MIVSTCSIFRQIGKKGVDEHLKELNSCNTLSLEPIKEDIFLPVYTIMLYAKEIEDNKSGLILNFPPIINHLCYNNLM